MRILIVESSEQLRGFWAQGLASRGHSVQQASDAEAALAMIAQAMSKQADYDCIVLDLMLPEDSGWEVIRELRDLGNCAHVLVVSDRDLAEDAIRALNLGADDFLGKPLEFAELRARIEASGRPHRQLFPSVDLGYMMLDQERRSLRWASEEVVLTAMEFFIVSCLSRRRGRYTSAQQILKQLLLEEGRESTHGSIEAKISILRRKLKDKGIDGFIRMRRGSGYYLA